MLVSTENTSLSFVSELVRGREAQRKKSVRLLAHIFIQPSKNAFCVLIKRSQQLWPAASKLPHYIITKHFYGYLSLKKLVSETSDPKALNSTYCHLKKLCQI